jgi:hypothetical protein
MRTLAALAVLLLLGSPLATAQEIEWHKDGDEARALAAKEKKLLLTFILVGEFDKPDC